MTFCKSYMPPTNLPRPLLCNIRIYMHNKCIYLSVSIYQLRPQAAANFKNFQHFSNSQSTIPWGGGVSSGGKTARGSYVASRYMNE